MAGISLGGLASGLDTNTMVTQLMAIERQPLGRLDMSRLRAEGRRNVIDELATKLRALNAAQADLSKASLWATSQAFTSGDTTKVTAQKSATATGDVALQTFSVTVNRLASQQVTTYNYAPRAGGNTTITFNGNAALQVSLPNGAASATQMAAAINARSDLPVTAAVNGSGQLVFTGKTVGATFSATTNGTLNQVSTTNPTAAYTITSSDGTSTSSTTATSNSVTFNGTTFDLKAITGGTPASVRFGTPARDDVAITKQLKAFVDLYNETVDWARTKLGDARVRDAKNLADASKGVLRGDVGLSSVLSNMRIALSSPIGGGAPAARDTLAEVGISVLAPVSGKSDADRLEGKLVLDETKFAAALSASAGDVKRVFDVVGGKLDAILEPFSRSQTGVLAVRSEQATNDIGRIKSRYSALEQRLGQRELRLREYFTQLETALGASQSQTAWLQGQIAGLG